jgi:hypothetical protein
MLLLKHDSSPVIGTSILGALLQVRLGILFALVANYNSCNSISMLAYLP